MQEFFQEQISVVFLMGEKVKGKWHEKGMPSDKNTIPEPPLQQSSDGTNLRKDGLICCLIRGPCC